MSLNLEASKRKVTPSPPRGLDITVAKVSARVGFVYLFLKSATPCYVFYNNRSMLDCSMPHMPSQGLLLFQLTTLNTRYSIIILFALSYT